MGEARADRGAGGLAKLLETPLVCAGAGSDRPFLAGTVGVAAGGGDT